MIDEIFQKELIESGYIHAPLPLHQERSLEAEREKREVLKHKVIWGGDDNQLVHTGIGSLKIQENAGKKKGDTIRVIAPTAHDVVSYSVTSTEKPVYSAEMGFEIPAENWEEYNRISFWVKPDSPGSRSVHIRVHIKNEGKFPIPDPYYREGQHLVNLVNHEWNRVIWEFASLPRDKVTKFSVVMDADGHDTSTGETFQFDFEDIRLEYTKEIDKEHGWTCQEGKIAYSMSGYNSIGKKTAVANLGSKTFSVLNSENQVVLTKDIVQAEDSRGHFEILDFGEITKPGFYKLKSGEVYSSQFEIGPNIMTRTIWKILNFIFCERCGYPVPEKHGCCHRDVIVEYKGLIKSYAGGWHDAGDMSQQTVQTAEVAQEILELASKIEDNTLLRQRLMEEGLWGIEHTLSTRFGDGFRASSVGLGAWTGGFIGDQDDVKTRVHNQSFQNFFCSAVEAQAGLALRDYDPELAWKCIQVAKDDYWFAKERFLLKGVERPIIWEHTLNSGLSQHYAAAAWAAASICLSEYDESFQKEAEDFADKLIACQETGTKGVPMKGFFYRDETHRTIVHFTHQGRDHSFVQALESLCQAFPNSKKRNEWEDAMKLYGEYLKELFKMATPYGMMPAGLHSIEEINDQDTFEVLHLLVDYENEKNNYKEQLYSGIDLGEGFYVRMFPVWFSFRGNLAIQLAMGKAAALLGKYFDDQNLKDIAMEQLYWTAGKNPFCQSLIYGEGERYAQQDANYPGEMTGEVPVGIETLMNEDIPYWPSGNNATYKEVWLTPAGRWLSIAAELYPNTN